MNNDTNGAVEQDQEQGGIPIPQELLATIGEQTLIIRQLERENASLRQANAALARKLEDSVTDAADANSGD